MNRLRRKLAVACEDTHKALMKAVASVLSEDQATLDISFDNHELFQLRMLPELMSLIEEERGLLKEQFQDDKEVQYVVETMEIEGSYYTLVNKLRVSDYMGPRSTMTQLAWHLKSIDAMLWKLLDEKDTA